MNAKRGTRRAAKPRTAALYLRISKKAEGTLRAETHEGDTSYSVDDQRVRCEALCAMAGYEVGPVYYDDGVSAYRSLKDRPGYGELRDAIGTSAFDVLVFDRQDRLARDQIETMDFIVQCARAGVEWHSAQEDKIDLHDTMSIMVAMFRGGQAQEYSDKISKNQMSANERKRQQGLPGAGGRPFGYEADKVTIRRDEADLIRRGSDLILSGAARWQVLTLFRESGLKSVRGNEWHIASVTAILRRWRNAGWVEHNDQPHIEAVWPAIVTKDDVEKIRAILKQGRTPGRWKQPTQLCSGIARCECGETLVVTNNDGVPAYRCSGIVRTGKQGAGTHVTIRAELLNTAVRDAVIDAYFSRPTGNGAGKAEAEQLTTLYRRRDAARDDRKHAQKGYEDHVYNAAEAAARVAAADAQIAGVDAEIDAAAARSAHAAMLQESTALLWANAAERASALDLGQGRAPDESLIRSYLRRGFTRDEAITAAVYRYWKDNPERETVRTETGRRFDSLDLVEQRQLVSSLLTINVACGSRGAERVKPQARVSAAESLAMRAWRQKIAEEEQAERRAKRAEAVRAVRRAYRARTAGVASNAR